MLDNEKTTLAHKSRFTTPGFAQPTVMKRNSLRSQIARSMESVTAHQQEHRHPLFGQPAGSILLYLCTNALFGLATRLLFSPADPFTSDPTAGIELAFLTLYGVQYAPIVLLGHLMNQWIWLGHSTTWQAMVFPPVLSVIGYSLAALVLRKALPADRFPRQLHDASTLCLAALLTPLLTGAFCSTAQVAAGTVPFVHFSSAILRHWLGSAVNVIVLTPAILVFLSPLLAAKRNTTPSPPTGLRWDAGNHRQLFLRMLPWAGCLALLSLLATTSPLFKPIYLVYLCFIPLALAALCWGIRGAVLGILLLGAGTAVCAHWLAISPGTLAEIQLVVLVQALLTLLLAGAISEQAMYERAYRREYTYFNSFIDLIPLYMLAIDQHRHLIKENIAHYQLFVQAGHLHWWQMTLYTPDTRELIPREEWPIERALRGEVTELAEAILVLPNGREMPILLHAAPVYHQQEPTAAVMAFQDISAQRETDKVKSDFLAVVSHELLTPLSSILGWAQEGKTKPELAVRALNVIARNARRQQHLLADLLDASRIMSGQLEPQLALIDLWQVANVAGEDFANLARDRNIALQLYPAKQPLPIMADAEQLRQAIGNMLSNAVKFTDAGGEIIISSHRDGEYAMLTVRDNGRGLPPESLPHIFTMFKQVQRCESTGGLGLGLMLVKGIVESHGGRVLAASPGLGQGSIFTIELPLATVIERE